MQHITPIDQLITRADRIGLELQALAKEAGVARSTIYRAAGGKGDVQVGTVQKLDAALCKYELELRDHLIALHGLPQAGEQAV